MTSRPILTKDALLEDLRRSAEESVARLCALPADAFEHGRYENGWNGRQILAHMASIEWTYPRLIELASSEQRPWASRADDGRRIATARGGIDAYNDREVTKRANVSAAALIDEFERNRATLIAAVQAAEESLLSVPIRSAGGVTAELGRVLHSVAVGHVISHTNDIAGP